MKITIRDMGTKAVYELAGDRLTMTDAGGCRDGLNEGGCELTEAMGDEAIIAAVTECWVAGATKNQGEEYDPVVERLSVTVTR